MTPEPRPFLWGVATADHQCEAFEPAWADVRDAFDTRYKLTERGRATDFWNRYAEDIQHAADLGCRAFRFSVAWARVAPSEGQVDNGVLDHYADLARQVRAHGMEPIITLHHYTWPLHVDAGGEGMLDPAFPERFAQYAAVVAGRLAEFGRYWITFNEPTELVFGYVKPWWAGEYRLPPGRDPARPFGEQLDDVARLIPNLFRAHTQARDAIQAVDSGALVSTNPFILGLPRPLRWFLDLRTKRMRDASGLGAGLRLPPRRARGGGAGGTVDLVIALLSAVPDRGAAIDFSIPYKTGCLRVLVPVASILQKVEEVGVGPVAVVAGHSSRVAARGLLPGATVRAVASYSVALKTVDSGRAAGLLADEIVLEQLAGTRYRLLEGRLGAERYVVGVPKGRPALLAAVNQVIEAGDAPVAGTASPGLTVEEGWLTVAVRGDLPGISFQQPDGTWTGTEVDLARRIAAYVAGDPEHVRFTLAPLNDKVRPVRSRVRLPDQWARWISTATTLLNSNWWHLGMAGELPSWLCPPECVGKQDFVGFDYYWGAPWYRFWRLAGLSAAAAGQFQDAPVWPGGLLSSLRYLGRKFPGSDLMIVENGSVEAADGVPRARYLALHLDQLARALRQGVHVVGYVCWAITSNREWGLYFAPGNDFGLFHVELDADPALIRKANDSSRLFGDFITRFQA